MGLHWGNIRVTSGLHWVILGLYWGYIGVILGLHWGSIWVILGLYWGYIGVILGLHWGNIRVTLGLYCGYIGFILGLHWGNIRVTVAVTVVESNCWPAWVQVRYCSRLFTRNNGRTEGISLPLHVWLQGASNCKSRCICLKPSPAHCVALCRFVGRMHVHTFLGLELQPTP